MYWKQKLLGKTSTKTSEESTKTVSIQLSIISELLLSDNH